MPNKLTEQGPPSAEERRNRLSSVATLTTDFQTVSGSNVSTITVSRELHEMGFQGQAAAHKPKIIHNAERRLPLDSRAVETRSP